jgi:hypothetical protein
VLDESIEQGALLGGAIQLDSKSLSKGDATLENHGEVLTIGKDEIQEIRTLP